LRGFGGRRLRLLQMVFDAELLPLEPAHLVERQHLDALDIAEAGRELGDLLMSSRSSVKPGTSTNRTQIGRLRAARRRASVSVGPISRPVSSLCPTGSHFLIPSITRSID
jgi:hypothetical protein